MAYIITRTNRDIANLWLLGGVIGLVLFSGSVRLGSIGVGCIQMPISGCIRDVGLLSLTWASWHGTSRESRNANGFSWDPIIEVAYLFAAIFVTITAPLAMLGAAQGGQGALHFVNAALFDATGSPNDVMFFWVTGMLSSVLDNAPTYLIFFDAAGGHP